VTPTADAAERPRAARGGLLAHHPLLFFFIMAFAFSWIAWAPWVLSEEGAGLLPFSSPLLAAALPIGIFLGPTLAAFIMTATTEGRAGIRRLLRRIVLWRVGLRWYLFALIGVPLVIPLVLTLGMIIVPGGLASLQFLGPGYVLAYPVSFVVTLIIGPLFEEIGWRGFALPRMQPLHGPLVGSIILGLLWALWHLPEFMVPWWAAQSGGTSPIAIVKFGMIATALGITLTWVFNNTKGSVLMAILVHTSVDAPFLPFSVLLGPSELINSILVGFGALALLVVVLTRGRLGYEHYQQVEEDPDLATASR